MILENIRQLCRARGITIHSLEKATGIGNGTISRWDESSPRVDSLQAVARYFCVTLDELLADPKNISKEEI